VNWCSVTPFTGINPFWFWSIGILSCIDLAINLVSTLYPTQALRIGRQLERSVRGSFLGNNDRFEINHTWGIDFVSTHQFRMEHSHLRRFLDFLKALLGKSSKLGAESVSSDCETAVRTYGRSIDYK